MHTPLRHQTVARRAGLYSTPTFKNTAPPAAFRPNLTGRYITARPSKLMSGASYEIHLKRLRPGVDRRFGQDALGRLAHPDPRRKRFEVPDFTQLALVGHDVIALADVENHAARRFPWDERPGPTRRWRPKRDPRRRAALATAAAGGTVRPRRKRSAPLPEGI